VKKTVKIALIVIVSFFAIILVGPFLVPVPPLQNTVPVNQLADPDSLFIDVNGLTIHYKMMGKGKPAIVLLHGFGASTYSWREVMDPLSTYGTVIAYDRPAFGLTERPMPGEWQGESPYSPSEQVNQLFGLLDALGADKVILIGNSAGGAVAANAVLKDPSRVLGLVLVDAAIDQGSGVSALLQLLAKTPQANHLGPLISRQIREWGVDFLNSAWHDPAKITPEILENYQKPLRVHNWDRALWELTRASGQTNLAARLGELDLPVLVVTGDDDRIIPTAGSIRLAGEIPGARLEVFENCGHVPQEECPDAFLSVVENLIISILNKDRGQ